jgi:hypothetical protein
MKFQHGKNPGNRSRSSAPDKRLLLLNKLLILVILLLFSSPQMIEAEEQIAHEYQIKAAFLYNFAYFVEWPADALSSPSSNLHICILGKDPFGEEIEAITNKSIGSHQISHGHIDTIEAIKTPDDCHILFITQSEKDSIPQIVSGLGGKPILTVTDQENADQSGVMITMTLMDEKVRFQINRKAAADVGINISSKLLRLATKVVE